MLLKSLLRVVLVASVFLGAVDPILAKVAETTLCELTAVADYIVVAKTEELMQVDGVTIGRATVEQTIKGDLGREFYFLAESTWTCDISGGEVGEIDLLFLTQYKFQPSEKPRPREDGVVTVGELFEPPGFKAKVTRATGSSRLMHIAWSGRGQMPLRTVDGDAYVTIWTEDVQLPTSVETIDGPEAEYAEFIRSAPLDHILSLVRRYLKTCGRSS